MNVYIYIYVYVYVCIYIYIYYIIDIQGGGVQESTTKQFAYITFADSMVQIPALIAEPLSSTPVATQEITLGS